VPAFAIKLLFGEMGETLLLGSLRVKPNRLEQAAYEFKHAQLEQGLRAVLQKKPEA
jgi:NAD dependent epimerase/dehydratase family enzyme